MPTLTLQRLGHVAPLAAGDTTCDSSNNNAASSSSRLHAYVHLLPTALLLASACVSRNQCVLRLLCYSSSSSNDDSSTATTHDERQQQQQQLPADVRATFRSPRTIALHGQDEGSITALELVAERLPPRTHVRDDNNNDSNNDNDNDDDAGVCVLLFIGTSNGTVLVCNALRQTIVYMAQYQYHCHFGLDRNDDDNAQGSNNNNDNGVGGAVDDARRASASPRAVNQRVVCFAPVRRHTPPALLLLSSASTSTTTTNTRNSNNRHDNNSDDDDDDERATQLPLYSTTRGVDAVYVVHDGGKVVALGRDVLDVCVDVVAQQHDMRQRRPHFVLDWAPHSALSSYPLAGPAATRVASLVTSVYTLHAASSYARAEQCALPSAAHSTRTTTATTGAACATSLVCDAVVRTSSPLDALADIATAASVTSTADLSALLMSSSSSSSSPHGSIASRPLATLCVCGRAPAVALYTLERTRAAFSPRRTVAAVTSLVTGVARTLWRSAWRKRSNAEDDNNDNNNNDSGSVVTSVPRRLDKLPQQPHTSQLHSDTTFTSVALDPTQRWLALCSSSSTSSVGGAGRVYVCDAQTSVVCRVLKGCRAAQCTWWWWAPPSSSSSSSRVRLLLVVHLPLRQVVELYSLRTHARVAACALPRGSVLLRCSCSCRLCGGGGGCGAGARRVLCLTPSGDVLRLSLRLRDDGEDERDDGAVASAMVA